MARDLPTTTELAAMEKVWQAIPSATMPTIERMIEIIQAQAEEIDRLNAEIERS